MENKKNILVVDDSALMRRLISDIINSDERFQVSDLAMNGLEAFDLVTRDPRRYEAVLLDINMPKMNGIELGLKLRSINSDGVIIYLTTSRDYAVESYLVQAFYYLLKPVDKTAFYTVLDKAVSMLEKQSMASIEVRTANGIRRLSFDEIMYVELAKRFAKYHLTDEKVINSITLRNSFHTEVAPLLKDERFTLCGTSFAVNLHHVIAVEKTDLILKGEHRVPLSRSKYIPVKKQWADYWLRRSSV